MRAARLLLRSGRYQPQIFFDVHPPYDRDYAEATQAGIPCLGPDGLPIDPGTVMSRSFEATLSGVPEDPRARRVPVLHGLPEPVKRMLRAIRSASLGTARRTIVPFLALTKRMAGLARLLDRERPSLLLLPGDSIAYGTPMLIRAARERGIPTVITPFTISNALEVVCDLRRFDEYDLTHLSNRITAALFPKWRFDFEGRSFLRASPWQVFAFEGLGLAPAKPWILNSGRADLIAVESEFMRDFYVRSGLPVDGWPIVGNLGDDILAATLDDAKNRKAELLQELDLPEDRPIALLALSDFSYFFKFTRHDEFAGYEELTSFWLDTLASLHGWNVVVSLHPWMRYEEKRSLERPGLRISRRTIEELVPLCDLYVASISATVRMALACGKPVVDHDVFAFRLDNFVGIEGVLIEETRAGFESSVRKLALDHDARERTAARIRAQAPRFGLLDSRTGERFLTLCDRLTLHAAELHA